MALVLQVPYEEKDEAKALGAKWNPQSVSYIDPLPEKLLNY